MADHVRVGELDDADAPDPVDQLQGIPKAAALAARQIGLRDVAGDHGLRIEAHAREEHLHLRRRGVLRLVEDDERSGECVVRDDEIVGDVELVRRIDRDAHGLGAPLGLDRVNVALRPTTTMLGVQRGLARETERLGVLGEPDVHHERVVQMLYGTSVCKAGAPTLGRSETPVGNAAERAHQERDIVAKLRRGGRVLDAAGPGVLRHWSTVGVEEALQHGEADLDAVLQVELRHELGARPCSHQSELSQHGSDGMRCAAARTVVKVANRVVGSGLVP